MLGVGVRALRMVMEGCGPPRPKSVSGSLSKKPEIRGLSVRLSVRDEVWRLSVRLSVSFGVAIGIGIDCF